MKVMPASKVTTCRFIAMLVLLTALPLATAGCGKKGPPKPPIKVRPSAVSDLALRQQGRSVLITFSLPTVTTTGIPLTNLSEAQLLRVREEEPEARQTTASTTAPRGRFIPAYDFLKKAETLATLAPADLARLARKPSTDNEEPAANDTDKSDTGPKPLKIEVKDDLVTEPIGGEAPNRLYYGVIVTDADGRRSDLSNIQSLVPLEPPAAPVDLTATLDGPRVKLDWSAPSSGSPPKKYRIYRAAGGGEPTAIATVAASQTDYSDLPMIKKGEVSYQVRSSASLDQPYVESEEAASATVNVSDTEAPDAPGKVRASATRGRVEVFWDKSKAPDIAGYNVFRSEKRDGPWTKLTERPLASPSFVDTGASAGVTYYYAVTAIDRNDNESAKSEVASARR